MNILLIEDEEPAANRLIKILKLIDENFTVVDVIVSVKSAIEWLRKNPAPDLILSDIQLADGKSLEIFETIKPKCPCIFITAHDEYVMQALKLKCIDYILKPVNKDLLAEAIYKAQRM